MPSVSYKSILCREKDQDRALIFQQSYLEDGDLKDTETIPWLFKRWVSMRPAGDGDQQGMIVESYRTASYATGKTLYSETAQYDSFCEHIIKRYAESNAMLERMMALDGRFPNMVKSVHPLNFIPQQDDSSDRIVANLLLF